MPSVTKEQKTMEGLLSDNNYPSSVDNMVRSDKPFEGSTTSLPPSETNPVFGADGTLPVTTISKVK